MEKIGPSIIVMLSLESDAAREKIRQAYLELLRRYDFNKSQLVHDFGIARQTLYNKLEKYGLPTYNGELRELAEKELGEDIL